MRIVVVLLLAALAAGCVSPASRERGTSALQLASMDPRAPLISPRLDEDRLLTGDGAVLPLRRWLPEGSPSAVILALHGFNDYSNAFADPGAAWARQGIATYAYDQRGFGAAPERGRWAGERQLVGDVATAAGLLRQRYPETPLYLLGESMGGAVAILAASGRSGAPTPDVDGVILVAPAVWGRQTMNLAERIGLWVADLVPGLELSPDALPVRKQPSDNVPMLRALGADPLVIKDTRAGTVSGLVDLMSAALNAGPRFVSPALLLYGERDEIVPREPMARFVEELPARARLRQRIALYPKGYHMLLRDLDGPVLIEDVGTWIRDAAAPLPSGADHDARAHLTGRKEPVTSAAQ